LQVVQVLHDGAKRPDLQDSLLRGLFQLILSYQELNEQNFT